MGVVSQILKPFMGSSGQGLVNSIEIFKENSEKRAVRDLELKKSVIDQFSNEFSYGYSSKFNAFIDGVNRLPRPLMAFGAIGIWVSAMIDPIWFATRMQSLALVPEPLWWLVGVVVSFYFGGRFQMKSQEFKQNLAMMPQEIDKMRQVIKRISRHKIDEMPSDKQVFFENSALQRWKEARDE